MTVLANWGLMSQKERDDAYNNSDAVPNSTELNTARAEASLAYRAAHAGHLDLLYGPTERTGWDLFPASDPNAPCLVFIHGGYWQRNSRDLFGILGEGIQAHGWSVAMPGYTLAPEASMTQIVGEIDSALTWLAAHGAAHGIAGKIYVTGWSAGGHLTVMALSHPAVVAGLSISGVFELGTIRDTYLNDKMKFTQAEVEAFSPLRLPVVQKPLSLAFGTQELAALVEDSQALHAKRVAAHAPGMLVPVPNTNHFTILDALRSPTGIITRQILDLAQEHKA